MELKNQRWSIFLSIFYINWTRRMRGKGFRLNLDQELSLHTHTHTHTHKTSLVAHRVKKLPAMQETRFPSLGQEDPLEKEMATHSSILPGEPQRQRSLAGYSPWGHKQLDRTERLTTSTCICEMTCFLLYTLPVNKPFPNKNLSPGETKPATRKPSATSSLGRTDKLGGCERLPSVTFTISYGKQGISMWTIKKAGLAPDS